LFSFFLALEKMLCYDLFVAADKTRGVFGGAGTSGASVWGVFYQ
jgi:hypothetical protein